MQPAAKRVLHTSLCNGGHLSRSLLKDNVTFWHYLVNHPYHFRRIDSLHILHTLPCRAMNCILAYCGGLMGDGGDFATAMFSCCSSFIEQVNRIPRPWWVFKATSEQSAIEEFLWGLTLRQHVEAAIQLIQKSIYTSSESCYSIDCMEWKRYWRIGDELRRQMSILSWTARKSKTMAHALEQLHRQLAFCWPMYMDYQQHHIKRICEMQINYQCIPCNK